MVKICSFDICAQKGKAIKYNWVNSDKRQPLYYFFNPFLNTGKTLNHNKKKILFYIAGILYVYNVGTTTMLYENHNIQKLNAETFHFQMGPCSWSFYAFSFSTVCVMYACIAGYFV